jgi:hypothetical protein
MDLREIDIAHVVGGIIVADLAAGPVDAFDFDDFAGRDFCEARIIRVPAVLLAS